MSGVVRRSPLSGLRPAGAGLLLWLLGLACSPAAGERELHVSVAVSLLPPVREAARLFERSHPGLRVHVNAGASGVLLQQTLRGAPTDLFLAASPGEIDRLDRLVGVVAGTRRRVASNSLVVVVPAGETPPARLEELAGSRFDSIAVGNPRTAPVGRYAAAALDALGLDEELAGRLVHGESARQVLDYVARGEVDAGLVYRTDAALAGGRVVVAVEIPAGAHDPIEYVAAVPAGAEAPGLAADFAELLLSPAGRGLLARHGFGAAP